MPRKLTFAEVSEAEIDFMCASLAKLKNPKHRYFVTLVMDLLVDALNERSEVTIPELMELGLAVTR